MGDAVGLETLRIEPDERLVTERGAGVTRTIFKCEFRGGQEREGDCRPWGVMTETCGTEPRAGGGGDEASAEEP